jgi:hypothetical protein
VRLFQVEKRSARRMNGPPDVERLAGIQARCALTMDFDSIGPLMEQHRLQP